MVILLYSETPLKGHPSAKDIYVIKDTYQSPKYHVTVIFYPLTRGHLTVKDKKYCPIGVHLIGIMAQREVLYSAATTF